MKIERADLERGFSLIDVLIGAAIFLTVILALAFAGTAIAKAGNQAKTNGSVQQQAENLVQTLAKEAASAIAIFTPATDIAGQPNADGHEVDVYTRDAHGVGAFDAYCWAATAGDCAASAALNTVTSYSYTTRNSGASGTITANGVIAQNVTSFTSQTIHASQLLNATTNPTSAAYFAARGITSVTDVVRATGYPNVFGGNLVTMVSFTTTLGTRTVHMLAGEQSTHQAVVVGTYTPPPNPLTIASGANLTFVNPLAAAQIATVAESNYGTQTTTPAQVYTVIGTTCGPYASENPAPTVTPVHNGSGDGSVTVKPLIKTEPSGANCAITLDDNSGQTQTVGVAIGQTYTPTAAGPATAHPGQTGTFTVAENSYAGASGGGGFTAATSGSCSGATLATETGAGAYSATWTVTFNTGGLCYVTFTDVYGQQVTANVNSTYGPLTVNPTALTFADPVAPAQSFTANEDYYSGPITVNATACNGYATESPGSENTDANFNAAFSVNPVLGEPACNMVVTDNHGGSVNVSVTVQDPSVPCSGGTSVGYGTPCPSPSPTNPCLTNCTIWYETDQQSATTYASGGPLGFEGPHGEEYDFTIAAQFIVFMTTDGGNTWAETSHCTWQSENAAGAYYSYYGTNNCYDANGNLTSSAAAVTPSFSGVNGTANGGDGAPDPPIYWYEATGQSTVDMQTNYQHSASTGAWKTTIPTVTTLPFLATPTCAENSLGCAIY